MELDRRPWPLFHFGMTGVLRDLSRRRRPRPRFWKVEIAVEDGTRLAMPDPRRLRARASRRRPAARGAARAPRVRRPRGAAARAGALAALLARRGAPVKAVLLDQSLFAGVGNWIADEALYQAAIDPRRPASALARPTVARLRARLHGDRAARRGGGCGRPPLPAGLALPRPLGTGGGARTARGEPIATSRSAAGRRRSCRRASGRRAERAGDWPSVGLRGPVIHGRADESGAEG